MCRRRLRLFRGCGCGGGKPHKFKKGELCTHKNGKSALRVDVSISCDFGAVSFKRKIIIEARE